VSKNKIGQKLLRRFLSGLCLIAWFFIWPKIVLAEKHIVINEIQAAGATSDDEFIELYNPNDTLLI
jgi:hypothetical protein